ncbi:MAG: calcium-binding protein, partial [Pseudomonas sp.]|uniref:calcium-binding protein n=1 Tax=Pseudomonas sp. TaxID=306 RepID=UPI003392FDEF
DTLVGYATDDTVSGGEGNDLLYGRAGHDLIEGGLGDDQVFAEVGNDRVLGGEGNDSLRGDAGNDTLDGGAGKDSLNGGDGSDTYLFGKGSGQDVISNNDAGIGIKDTLQLAEGTLAQQLWLRKTGNSLEVSVIGTGDKVTINDWYSNNNYHLEQFKTADGKTLLDSQVQNLVNAMAAFGVPAGGEGNLTASQREQLNVVIAANWQ